MDSISKRQKLSGEVKIKESEVDRISNLPSSVIGHILSFLPTKYAVATSVLSTKWKYLWTSLTTLDLDDSLLLVPFSPWDSTKQKLQEMSFIKFVYRVLVLNVSDLLRFNLRCTRVDDVSHLNAWISTALSRNVRGLHLYLHHMKEYNGVPRELFTCKSLVVIVLSGNFVLNVPTSVCLQNLRILRLSSIKFLDDDSIKRLFPSCPMLENLSIRRCDWVNIDVFNIYAPALKRLIINGFGCGLYPIFWKHKFVFNTPNLQYLDYKGYVAEGYSMNNLNALVTAKIGLFASRFGNDSLKELVEGMSKVQRLHLCFYSIGFCFFVRQLPRFNYLTYLELRNFQRWEYLLRLLESSPQLETLVLKGCFDRLPNQHNEDNNHWDQPQDVPSCLLFHLKVFEIKIFRGFEEELKMAEYFLKNGRVLEKLMIHISMNPKESFQVCKKLLMLSRGSQSCQVVIS